MRANFPVVDNAVQEMVDLMDESVLPADDMPVRPPVLPPGVMSFCDQHVVEALGFFGFLIHPEDLQLIHPFQVELDRTVLTVDLDDMMILATCAEA